MTTLTDIQFLNSADGKPQYAVLPIALFNQIEAQLRSSPLQTAVPARVADLALDNGYSALRAWREYLGLTQAEVAAKAGITQSAYSQHEKAQFLRKTTRVKLAQALGLHEAQLDF